MGQESAHSEIAGGLAAALSNAWNLHDMEAFASVFHRDAAFVNVNGTYARGRQEIQRHHEASHASFFRDSNVAMHLDDSRSPASDVIVAHVSSEVRGDLRAPDQVRRTLMTLVIELSGDQWMISAAHNTNVVAPPVG